MDLGPQTKTSLRKLETRAHKRKRPWPTLTVRKITELYVDASPFGLGAILTHARRPLASKTQKLSHMQVVH